MSTHSRYSSYSIFLEGSVRRTRNTACLTVWRGTQGWRTFAEEQGVRTGDQLDFTLLEERRLQISLTRRAVLEQQHVAEGFPATPDVPGQHGKSSTSSEDGQLLPQVLPLSFLSECCALKLQPASSAPDHIHSHAHASMQLS